MSDAAIDDTCMELAAVLASEVEMNEDPIVLKQRLDEAAALMAVVHDSHGQFKVTIAEEIKRQMMAREDVLRGAGLAIEDDVPSSENAPKRRGRKPKVAKSEDANAAEGPASALSAPTLHA